MAAILLAALLAVSPAFAEPAEPKPAPKAAPKPAPKPAPKVVPVPPPAAAVQPATAPAGEGQPRLLGQYGSWGAYTATPEGRKLCFALGKPTTSLTKPPGRPRDPPFVFVSNRPAQNVRHEISVMVGYPFKPSTDATAEVGPAKFAMQTQEDGAWIKNVAEEDRLIDAMRKGTDLTVKGTSGRGTVSTDTYSLKGLVQALDRADQECK